MALRIAKLNTEVDSLTSANKILTENNKFLKDSISTTDEITEKLDAKVKDIAAVSSKLTRAVNELERSNEKISQYLQSPVPDELARLYNERKRSLRTGVAP